VVAFLGTRPSDPERVAREAFECLEKSDGACLNRLRADAEKSDDGITDAQLTDLLKNHTSQRFSFNEPISALRVEKNQELYEASRSFRQGGVIALGVANTGGKYQVVNLVNNLVMFSAYALKPGVKGADKLDLRIRDVEEHLPYFESIGIKGFISEPGLPPVPWSQAISRWKVGLAKFRAIEMKNSSRS
jgi:hypothetical protein